MSTNLTKPHQYHLDIFSNLQIENVISVFFLAWAILIILSAISLAPSDVPFSIPTVYHIAIQRRFKPLKV